MNRQVMTIIAMAAACVSSVVSGQTFQPVPITSGSSAGTVRQLSRDGLTVVGRDGTRTRVTRWTVGGTIELIGPPVGFESTLGPVIGDSATVVAHEAFSANFTRAVVQRTGGQEVVITPFDYTNAISGDGSTIVGYRDTLNGIAVRWTASGGVQEFGTVQGAPLGPLSATARQATSASFDGSIVVGYASVRIDNQVPFPTTRSVPFIWSAAAGTRLLTNADGTTNINAAIAGDVTSDGRVVVGVEFTNVAALRLFRWSQTGGYQYFNINFEATGEPKVSDDGATIVYGQNFWTESSGVQTLQQVLTQAGCNFTGWTNLSAIDVSGDGRTIAGNGVNPQGQQQGWVATVPGPSGVVVVGSISLLALATRRRRNVR